MGRLDELIWQISCNKLYMFCLFLQQKVPFYRTDQQFPKRGASWFCKKLHTVRPWWGNRFLLVSVWRGKHHLVSVWSIKWPHGTIPGAWPLSAWQPVSKAGLSLTLWVIYKSPTSQQAMTFLGNISLDWERAFSERHISFWGMQWVRVVTANFTSSSRAVQTCILRSSICVMSGKKRGEGDNPLLSSPPFIFSSSRKFSILLHWYFFLLMFTFISPATVTIVSVLIPSLTWSFKFKRLQFSSSKPVALFPCAFSKQRRLLLKLYSYHHQHIYVRNQFRFFGASSHL